MCIRDSAKHPRDRNRRLGCLGIPLLLTGGGALGYTLLQLCLLYTSDAADERSSVDLGGRRIINKKKITENM